MLFHYSAIRVKIDETIVRVEYVNAYIAVVLWYTVSIFEIFYFLLDASSCQDTIFSPNHGHEITTANSCRRV